jgi:hypothetical protein
MNHKNPFSAFRPGLMMAPIRLSNESPIWILFPFCDQDRGNKAALLPDALDESEAFHQPQGLVEPSLCRMNCNLLHPIFPIPFPKAHNISARKFFGDLVKAGDGQPPLLPMLSATGSRVARCGELRPQQYGEYGLGGLFASTHREAPP